MLLCCALVLVVVVMVGSLRGSQWTRRDAPLSLCLSGDWESGRSDPRVEGISRRTRLLYFLSAFCLVSCVFMARRIQSRALLAADPFIEIEPELLRMRHKKPLCVGPPGCISTGFSQLAFLLTLRLGVLFASFAVFNEFRCCRFLCLVYYYLACDGSAFDIVFGPWLNFLKCFPLHCIFSSPVRIHEMQGNSGEINLMKYPYHSFWKTTWLSL